MKKECEEFLKAYPHIIKPWKNKQCCAYNYKLK